MMPFENEILTMLSEVRGKKGVTTRQKIFQLYEGEDREAALNTLNILMAKDAAKRRSKTPGSVAMTMAKKGGQPG